MAGCEGSADEDQTALQILLRVFADLELPQLLCHLLEARCPTPQP